MASVTHIRFVLDAIVWNNIGSYTILYFFLLCGIQTYIPVKQRLKGHIFNPMDIFSVYVRSCPSVHAKRTSHTRCEPSLTSAAKKMLKILPLNAKSVSVDLL